MLDFLLWNKIARIIAQLADTLHISTDRALQIFYDSDVCRMLHDKDLGLHLMSDTYIVNDLIAELRGKQFPPPARFNSSSFITNPFIKYSFSICVAHIRNCTPR